MEETRNNIFSKITGKYIVCQIINTKSAKNLGGGMKIQDKELGRYRIAEVLEVNVKDINQTYYSSGQYIATLPSRAEENIDFLGDKVVFIHPEDVIGILSDEKRLQVQKSLSS